MISIFLPNEKKGTGKGKGKNLVFSVWSFFHKKTKSFHSNFIQISRAFAFCSSLLIINLPFLFSTPFFASFEKCKLVISTNPYFPVNRSQNSVVSHANQAIKQNVSLNLKPLLLFVFFPLFCTLNPDSDRVRSFFKSSMCGATHGREAEKDWKGKLETICSRWERGS